MNDVNAVAVVRYRWILRNGIGNYIGIVHGPGPLDNYIGGPSL
jgi:hypothetical protein